MVQNKHVQSSAQRTGRFAALIAAFAALLGNVGAAPRADGELRLKIVDRESGQPIPARIHLQNARRRPVKLRLPKSGAFGDHFYIDGDVALPLPAGQYVFELEATPEYRTQSGHFEIERHADDEKTIEMQRFTDLSLEGWRAGDLDISRTVAELPLVMRAEGLSAAPTPDAQHRGLLIYNLPEPKNFAEGLQRKTSLSGLEAAHDAGAVVVARTPFEWDLPVWLASGKLDAILLINHHSLRDGVVDDEGEGRPRDRSMFPGATGGGRWAATIYYHVLGCGLRIPPAAGSGSGENASPLGTNRVYVRCGEEFSESGWWEHLLAGRVFVTNGPLLRPLVRGQPPGYVFQLDDTESLTLEIGLNLATREPVEYLQIIKNGEIEYDVRLEQFAQHAGRLPPVAFDDSGWFLVRAVTSERRKYQFASSGPYYVERGGRPRVSRRSVQFFLEWIADAEERLHDDGRLEAEERDELLAEQATARRFFEGLLAGANVD